MHIDQILAESAKEVLSEETVKLIREQFEAQVELRVADRLKLELEEVDKQTAEDLQNLVEKIDKDTTAKYQTLLEANDKDHTEKMKKLVSEMDKSYTSRLQLVKEHYEIKQAAEMEDFKNTLLEAIDLHIDTVLDEKIPAKVFHAAAAAYEAKKKQPVTESKKTPVKAPAKTKSVLETLCEGFDAEKRRFVTLRLEGQDEDRQKNNFEYVVSLYDRKQQAQKQVIAESAVRNSIDSHVGNDAEVSANKTGGYMDLYIAACQPL